MEWRRQISRTVFFVLVGLLFGGALLIFALETAVRRWRDDRAAATEPPADALEAAYRARRKATPLGTRQVTQCP